MLWTVSLYLGFELLHAAAVDTPQGLVAVVADQGGGKSTLAAELLRRGGTLFADDIVALEQTTDGLLAHPGPAVMNLPTAVDPASIPGARPLATFTDERWVELPGNPHPATPLRAVMLLRRAAGAPLTCRPLAATTLTLLPHAITLPHLTARGRQRFERFGALVATTPVLELTADLATPPAALADALQSALETV